MKTMKNKSTWAFLSVAVVFLTSIALLSIFAFNKADKITPQSPNISTGSDIIDIGDSSAAYPVHPNYKLDKVHCNVGWATLFFDSNAYLTGRFNMFNLIMHFDQKTPANTTITAWVQISTFNTGETGRDAPGKCGPTYLGNKYNVDTTVSPHVYTVIPSSDTARFISTSCENFGTGYVAHGNLNFLGKVKPVDLFFQYEGIHVYPSSSGGAPTRKTGFSGQFKMLARTDFGVTSTSIADEVSILLNMNCAGN